MTTLRQVVPFATTIGVGATIVSCLSSSSSLSSLTLQHDNRAGLFRVVLGSLALAPILNTFLFYLRDVLLLEFPGPTPLPILGNALSLVSKGNIQESVRALVQKYGNVIDLLLLDGDRLLLINDASFCKIAMKSMDRGDLQYLPDKTKHNDDDNNNNSTTTIRRLFRLPQMFWSTKRFREKLVWQDLWGLYHLDLFSRSDKIYDWKAHRRLLQPAFDQKHVRNMAHKIESAVENLVEKIPTGETIDALPLLRNYGLDMIYSTSLGQSVTDLPDQGQFIFHVLDNTMTLFEDYIFHPFPYFASRILPYLGLNSLELERRRNIPLFRKYCRDLIEKEQKRQAESKHARSSSTSKDSPEEATAADNDDDDDDASMDNLLSLMVAKLDDSFTIDNAVDELLAFLFAGYDTTSVTLGNLLFELANNPTAQQKIHDELDSLEKIMTMHSNNNENDETTKKKEDAGSLSVAAMIDQHGLPYLSACIRESQRLQPVASVLQRRLHQDVPLRYKDSNGMEKETTIRQGEVVFIPTFLLHRDEKQYPDPETFRPERWLRQEKNGESNNTTNGGSMLLPTTPGYFYAFGAGPKMCVGFQLAEKEVKMAAAGIFKNYAVASRGERKMVDHFTTGPENVLVEFTKRKTEQTQS